MDRLPNIQDSLRGYKIYIFILLFIILTPMTLISSALLLVSISGDQNSEVLADYTPGSRPNIFSALPSALPSISGQVLSEDARPKLIHDYLVRYNSPLVGHEEFIVTTADKFGLDYRLITAIAQQESNLCKKIPPGSYNCWGWGIHSRGTLHFESFEQGIETVSAGLKENYIDQGYTNPEEIMRKYTPLSKGSWANGVRTFMMQMR